MTVCNPAKKGPAFKKVFIPAFMVLISITVFLSGMVSVCRALDLMSMPSQELPSQMTPRMKYFDMVVTGNRLVAVGEYGLILYSDCGGATWLQASVPTSITLTGVCFPTAQKGWAVGHDGVVLATTDGGQTWQTQVSGLAMNKKALAQIDKKIAELSATLKTTPEEEKEILALRLEDMELLHSDMSAPVENNSPTSLMNVLFINENVGFAFGAFGMIIQTQNGGVDWEPIVDRMNNIYGNHYYGMEHIYADGRDVLLLAGEFGLLRRSMNGGKTWQTLESPHEGSFFGIKAANDQKTIVTFGLGGTAFFTDDLGETWRSLEIPLGLSISGALAFSDSRFLLTTANGDLFYTKKNGTGESLCNARGVPGSIAAVQISDNEFYLAGMAGLRKITISDMEDD